MQKIKYEKLNARQKEIYNFQKVSAIFADFGYTTVKLSDDWLGADFIAISFNSTDYLRVQLKGRLSFYKKYQNKDIFICFNDRANNQWYLYPHDKALKNFSEISNYVKEHDGWSSNLLSKDQKEKLKSYIFE